MRRITLENVNEVTAHDVVPRKRVRKAVSVIQAANAFRNGSEKKTDAQLPGAVNGNQVDVDGSPSSDAIEKANAAFEYYKKKFGKEFAYNRKTHGDYKIRAREARRKSAITAQGKTLNLGVKTTTFRRRKASLHADFGKVQPVAIDLPTKKRRRSSISENELKEALGTYLMTNANVKNTGSKKVNVEVKFQSGVKNPGLKGRRASFVAAFHRVEKAADTINDVANIERGGMDFYDPAQKFYPKQHKILKKDSTKKDKDATGEADERNTRRKRCTQFLDSLVVLPDAPIRVKWDLLLLVFVIYYGIQVPINISFAPKQTTGALVFDAIGQALFIFDIIFNFFTAVRPTGVIVVDRWIIATLRAQMAPY